MEFRECSFYHNTVIITILPRVDRFNVLSHLCFWSCRSLFNLTRKQNLKKKLKESFQWSWWGTRRHRRPEYLLGEVVPEWTRGSWRNHVGTVQGQSPSERSFGTRSRRSYSSGRFLFNDSFGKCPRRCVGTSVGTLWGVSLPLFWLYRKRRRPSWFACSPKLMTSRLLVNLLRFKTNMFSHGNVYLDMINKFYFLWCLCYLTYCVGKTL